MKGSLAVLGVSVLLAVGSGSAASGQDSSDIYSIALDGGDLRNLTNTPGVSEAYLSRSPDGTKLAYFSTEDARSWWVNVSNADGTGARRVAPYSRSDNFRERPAWSLDGRQIAYTQGFGCTGAVCELEEVWATDVVSGQSKRLAKRAVQPAWSASRLAYVRARLIIDREPSYRLSVISARLDGSRPQRIVRSGVLPSWSPSGRYLAYSGFDGAGPTRVFRVRRDGTQRRLVASPFDPQAVSWSPGGRHIAVVAGTFTTLYIVSPSGRGLRVLGRIDDEVDHGFSWSPNGRLIAWPAPNGSRIIIRAAAGGPPRTIATGKNVLEVVWSADGKRLFFTGF